METFSDKGKLRGLVASKLVLEEMLRRGADFRIIFRMKIIPE